MASEKPDRRDFFRKVSCFSVLAALSGMFQGCSMPRSVPYDRSGNRLVVQKKSFGNERLVLIEPARSRAPILLHRKEDGEHGAVLLLCTHQRCTVEPAGAILQCPCHGSEFSREGTVLNGPAERPLRSYPTSQNEKAVFIELNGKE